MGAGMEPKRYYVRWRDVQHGPWTLARARNALEASIEPLLAYPSREYEIREADGGAWCRACEFPGLSDLYEFDEIAPTTKPATPRAKLSEE